MELVSVSGGLAFIRVTGTENPDGSFIVASVTHQNLTAHPLAFTFRRGTGVSILTRTVNAGATETTQNVPGSAANRTLVSYSAVWNP